MSFFQVGVPHRSTILQKGLDSQVLGRQCSGRPLGISIGFDNLLMNLSVNGLFSDAADVWTHLRSSEIRIPM